MGKLVSQQECLVPATPLGIIEMLKRENIEIKGKNATMVGHSEIVGKPCTLLLLNEWATVTVCHIETRNLKMHTKDADILIVATGVPYLIKEDMVKEGAIVIDIGINRIEDGSLVGDVDFENVSPKCSYITPVPGGVGPMTIAMLLSNTLKSAKARG